MSLAAVAAPWRAPSAAPGFAAPAEVTRAFLRLRAALDERIVFWWLDDVRSAVVGTRVYPLFRARVGTFLRAKQVEPDAYAVTTLETSYYVSLDTDRLLTSIKNPVTGRAVDVKSVVLGPTTSILRASGEEPPRMVRGGRAESRTSHGPVSVVGDDVLIAEDRFTRIVFPDPATPPYNTSELNIYRGRLSELSDPQRPYVSAWVSYQSVSAFRPELNMGENVGHISARAIGAKVERLDQMPVRWRALIEQENPDIIADVSRALDHPPSSR
jgi:hypothetical protein